MGRSRGLVGVISAWRSFLVSLERGFTAHIVAGVFWLCGRHAGCGGLGRWSHGVRTRDFYSNTLVRALPKTCRIPCVTYLLYPGRF